MSYPINYPTPQGANVQIFRGGDANTAAHTATRDWVKPQGASFVWFTLIGAGGGGGGGMIDPVNSLFYSGGGGASGNVTNFMCPAFLIPDLLQVAVGKGGNGGSEATNTAANNGTIGSSTKIVYCQKDSTGYDLLVASGGGGGGGGNFAEGIGGVASSANTDGPMTAAGFYQCVRGQNGATGGTVITTNGLTFLMGGNGESDNLTVITGYYGYSATLRSGYSQLSPIPLSIPRISTTSSGKSSPQSFGCGGAGGGVSGISGNGGSGGDGLAIIVTW